MRKIVHEIINQAHKVVSVNDGKLYPVSGKHLVIGGIIRRHRAAPTSTAMMMPMMSF